jgi:hypothetical protein
MSSDHDLLRGLNKSELIQMARAAGLGNIGRNNSDEEIIEALVEATSPEEVPSCPLEGKRKKMEAHIMRNKRRLMSQLPNCTGQCTTFGCPDLIVMRCWGGFHNDIL